MSTAEKISLLHDWLTRDENEKYIDEIWAFLEQIQERDGVWGYTASGQPVTEELVKERLKQAKTQVEKGEFISNEEVFRRVDKW